MTSNYWHQRNVLVTGATGFLGSWLVEQLLVFNAHVVGIIRDQVPDSRLVCQKMSIVHVNGCVEDIQVLERTLNEYEIETVFHLAAQTIVGIANRSPLSTFEANIRGTYNLLEACRRVGSVKNIVIASSDKAYGEQAKLPYDESFSLSGAHPYDVSKSCADLIANCYYQSYDLPVCITRCGNFYGGGDLNFNRLIPGTIRSVLNGAPPVIRSDGTYIRDYIYIQDAVTAYLLLAEKMETLPVRGEAFNFSNESQKKALEIVEMILQLMDQKNLEPVVLAEASNEIPKQYLSAKKARERLNWKPRYSLEEGLKETIAWYRDFWGQNRGK
ncbi:MAG: GDP-mannose 4,6-dehydratase [Nitrospinales bacterium]